MRILNFNDTVRYDEMIALHGVFQGAGSGADGSGAFCFFSRKRVAFSLQKNDHDRGSVMTSTFRRCFTYLKISVSVSFFCRLSLQCRCLFVGDRRCILHGP
jgi:hypothetical protein